MSAKILSAPPVFQKEDVFRGKEDKFPYGSFYIHAFDYGFLLDKSYHLPDVLSEPKTVPELFIKYYFEKADWKTQRKIDNFIEKLGIFDEKERGVVIKALMIATVAHQFNLNEEKQIRKADKAPYITHSIEMAEKFLDIGLSDWLTTAAILLHDVAEDADLGSDLKGKEHWLSIIKEEFNAFASAVGLKAGFEGDKEVGDLLAELVDGVTDEKLPTDEDKREEIIALNKIRLSPFFRIIEAYLKRGSLFGKKRRKDVQEISPKTYIILENVSYALMQMFDKALKSPDHWRIFLIKILDVWHNFQTIEWVKEEKLLRGRIAAGLAEWMGLYELRSEIVEKMAQQLDMTHPYTLFYKNKESGFSPKENLSVNFEKFKENATKIAYRILDFFNCGEYIKDLIIGWPLVDADYRYYFKLGSFPYPFIYIMLDERAINHFEESLEKKALLQRPFFLNLGDGHNNLITLRYIITRKSMVWRQVLGRKIFDLIIKSGHGYKTLCGLRIEDNKPHIKDLFKGETRQKITQIPEVGLFNNDLIKDPEKWKLHLLSLIGFLYSSEAFSLFKFSSKSPVTIIGISYSSNGFKKLIFVNCETIMTELTGIIGIEYPVGDSVKKALKRQFGDNRQPLKSPFNFRIFYT